VEKAALSDTGKSGVITAIKTLGLVPVIRAESSEIAMRATDAIKEGGVNILEITMTVPGAVGVIEEVAKRYGDDVIVGAGTVLDAETARVCILAGARFVVSPSLDLETIECCRRYSVPVMPGALTPTEVVAAWQAGADMVKVFPCNAVGGASYIKALKGPFPRIDFVPTGGVSLKTAADFIKAGSSALGVGGDLVDTKAIAQGQADFVTERARQFLEIINNARSNRS
jgi:2-dehydro-3-deoxyphosphogluconate aldolase/(4S)-4-hydroxy-2-oxoglutarate aldolase